MRVLVVGGDAIFAITEKVVGKMKKKVTTLFLLAIKNSSFCPQ